MRFERVVANASPLICMFRGGYEGLLAKLWDTIDVPEAVWQEILNGPKNDPAAAGGEDRAEGPAPYSFRLLA